MPWNLPREQWPSEDCGFIIDHYRHLCHVPAEAWEMKQEDVCFQCLRKNALHKVCRRCEVVTIRQEFWDKGARLCGECFSEEESAHKKAAANRPSRLDAGSARVMPFDRRSSRS